MTDSIRTYEGPLMEAFSLPLPNRTAAVTVTHERSRYGMRYVVWTPRGSYGRDSIRDAFDTMVSAYQWEMRVLRHHEDGHSEAVVAQCQECAPHMAGSV